MSLCRSRFGPMHKDHKQASEYHGCSCLGSCRNITGELKLKDKNAKRRMTHLFTHSINLARITDSICDSASVRR